MSQAAPILTQPPFGTPFVDKNGDLSNAAAAWLSGLSYAQILSGTTATRPTTNLVIGMPYMDTDLGFSINLLSTGPDVWVDGAGAVV